MKQNKTFLTIAIVLLSASLSFAAKQNTYTTKTTPVGADKVLITDSEDSNKTKQANINAMRSALGLGTTADVVFGNVNASGGTLSAGVANTTQGTLILYTNTNPVYAFGLSPAASPSATVSLKAPASMPSADNSLFNCDINGTCDWTSPTAFLTPTGSGASLTIDASGFDGNLTTSDNTLQEIVQKIDDLTVGAGADDQTASEVNITDAGLYYTGTTVEAALQEIGLTYALKANYLSLTNTSAFTPSGDYHPATKKYVDDSITAGGGYTDEQAQDAVGGMFTGNTETGITVTYDDATAKVNFVVDTQLPGVASTGITGNLTLTKTGTTARTFTYPDAAGTVALTSDIPAAVTDATISTTDVTTSNASTTKHGWLLKATAPASGLRNLVAIDNGETVYKNAALFDATAPSTQALSDSAVVGTAMTAARRDHKHAMPAPQTTVSGTSGGLSAQYIDWTSSTGGTSIANKPTLGTAAALDYGTSIGNAVRIVDIGSGVAGLPFSLDLQYLTDTTNILAGKQAADSDLTSASGASAAGVSKYWGTNASSVVGFYDIPTGGSMTWPGTAGIAVYGGSSAWGTSLTAPSGSIVGTTDTQTLTNKTHTGPTYTSIVSTTTATGNINLDGVSASNYEYSNGSTAATYTPVFTSRPSSGNVRYITLTVGGGSGVDTMTWTNVTWMGTAGAAATTTNKKSSYACIVDSAATRCKIIAEAY